MHKSHNKASAQWELREKALQRRFRHPGSPAPLDQASLSIIREVCVCVCVTIFLLLLVSSLHTFIVLEEILFCLLNRNRVF